MRKVGDRRDGRLLYQGHKYRLALSRVPPSRRRVAVDVGSHVGLWAWQMAKDFQKVICFEPMPIHVACWHKNMVGVTNAELRQMALGPQPGKVWLKTRTPNSSGDTGVLTLPDTGEPWRPEEHQTSMATKVEPDGPAGGGEIEAICSTLNQELQDEPIIDFIKIDCEGFEQFIVQGGEGVIRQHKPVMIVEQKPETGMEARYGVTTTGAVDLLKNWGARVLAAKQGDYVVGWP